MKRIIDISEENYNHLCFLHQDDIYKIVENSTSLNEVEAEDCISREQALRELKESAEHHANDSREEVLLRRDRDIIRALPSVTSQEPRWISVSEKLPEEEKEVLVSSYDTYGKKVIIARYQGEKYGFTCGLVSAWQPLPKPYKEK